MGAFSYYENYFNNMKVSLVAWEEVCRLKFEGSLGIRQNEDVNREKHVKTTFFGFLKRVEIPLFGRKLLILENILEMG